MNYFKSILQVALVSLACQSCATSRPDWSEDTRTDGDVSAISTSDSRSTMEGFATDNVVQVSSEKKKSSKLIDWFKTKYIYGKSPKQMSKKAAE